MICAIAPKMTRKPLVKLSGIHNMVTTALIFAKRLNTKCWHVRQTQVRTSRSYYVTRDSPAALATCPSWPAKAINI